MNVTLAVTIIGSIGAIAWPLFTYLQNERLVRATDKSNEHYAVANCLAAEALKLQEHGAEAVAKAYFPGDVAAQSPPAIKLRKVSYWPSLAFALLAWSAVGFNYYQSNYRPQSAFDDPDYRAKRPPKLEWTAEKVPLDGYDYADCTFTDVTFTYAGKTPIYFSHNSVNTPFVFESDDDGVQNAIIFLKAAGWFRPGVPFTLPPNSRVDFPHHEAR